MRLKILYIFLFLKTLLAPSWAEISSFKDPCNVPLDAAFARARTRRSQIINSAEKMHLPWSFQIHREVFVRPLRGVSRGSSNSLQLARGAVTCSSRARHVTIRHGHVTRAAPDALIRAARALERRYYTLFGHAASLFTAVSSLPVCSLSFSLHCSLFLCHLL